MCAVFMKDSWFHWPNRTCVHFVKHKIILDTVSNAAIFPHSFSLTGTPLAQAQMMPPAGCLTCVPTRSWWCTAMTTSSVASPPWLSPRVAACYWLAMTTSTATCGTLWKASVPVSDLLRPCVDKAQKGSVYWSGEKKQTQRNITKF